MRTTKLGLSWAALLGIGVVSSAMGAVPDVFSMSLEELAGIKISSVTKTEQSVLDAPVMAYVVTQADIQQRGYRDLLDLLRDIPGVFAVSLSSTEHFGTELYIRGIDANRKLMILLDGHKINPPTGEPFTFLGQIPLINVKQVEFSYGGSSSLYGADAVAGLVNIVTFSGEEMRQGRIQATVGSHDTYEGAFFGGYSLSNGLAVSLAGKIHRSDIEDLPAAYPDPFGGYSVDLDERSHYLHAKAEFRGLSLSYMQTQTRRNNSTLYLPELYDYSGEAYWLRLDQYLALDYVHEFSEAWKTKSIIMYGRTRLKPESSYRADYSGARQFPTDYFEWKGESTRLAQEVYYKRNRLQMTSGAEIEFFNSIPKTDYARPWLGFYDLSYHNWAVFSQAEYQPWERWELVAGLRYDDNSRYDGVWNPRLAALFKPSDQWRLRASWGQAYLAPSPHLAYDRWGDLIEGGFVGLGNDDLQPERTDNFELGADWLPTTNLLLRAAGFYIHGRDLLGNSDPEPVVIDGVTVNAVRTINVNKSDVYGAQAVADWRATDWLRLDGHYTFTQGRQEDAAGERSDLPRMPAHLAQGHATVDYDRWICRLTANWFDHITTSPGNSLHEGGVINGKLTFDAYLAWRFKMGPAQARLGFEVANIFNEKVYKVSLHDDFFAALPEVPQERRRMYLTLAVDF